APEPAAPLMGTKCTTVCAAFPSRMLIRYHPTRGGLGARSRFDLGAELLPAMPGRRLSAGRTVSGSADSRVVTTNSHSVGTDDGSSTVGTHRPGISSLPFASLPASSPTSLTPDLPRFPSGSNPGVSTRQAPHAIPPVAWDPPTLHLACTLGSPLQRARGRG